MAGLGNVGMIAEKGVGVGIVSGVVTLTEWAGTLVISAETGTSDTLDGIALSTDLSTQLTTQHYVRLFIIAASGHTITVTDDHAALSPNQIALGQGANATLTDKHGLWIQNIGGSWYDSLPAAQLDGGLVGLKDTQTLENKSFKSYNVYGTPALYTGSQKAVNKAVLSTADATTTNLLSVSLAEGESIHLKISVLAHRDNQSAALGGTIEVKARRATAGNITQVGTGTTSIETDSTPTCVADFDTGSQSLRIRATGVAAQNWVWIGHYEYFKVLTSA